MRNLLISLMCLSFSMAAYSQDWEQVKADDSCIWGEGYGPSVDEADRQALSVLVSRIAVSVVNDYRQVEEQVSSSKGNEYYSRMSNRSSAYSNVTLSNTHRIVLRQGRRVSVGRWIRREDLEKIFGDRKERILEYEGQAVESERAGHLGDALRYHYWAYVLLRSLPRPSELRSKDGEMLLNSIPDRMNDIFDGIKVNVASHVRDEVRLKFDFKGRPVGNLDFHYFDGAQWSPVMVSASSGSASVEMARGALAEYIQLRVEYAYCGDSLMDGELYDTMSALNLKPIRKSFIVVRAGSCVKQ